MAKVCINEGCDNPRWGKGFCKFHQYLRNDKTVKPKKKQKSFRVISESLEAKLKVYRPLRDKYMREHPECEICNNPSQDLHHKAGRGKFLSDVTTFMAVCRRCHNYIHENPKKSRESLYLL